MTPSLLVSPCDSLDGPLTLLHRPKNDLRLCTELLGDIFLLKMSLAFISLMCVCDSTKFKTDTLQDM